MDGVADGGFGSANPPHVLVNASTALQNDLRALCVECKKNTDVKAAAEQAILKLRAITNTTVHPSECNRRSCTVAFSNAPAGLAQTCPASLSPECVVAHMNASFVRVTRPNLPSTVLTWSVCQVHGESILHSETVLRPFVLACATKQPAIIEFVLRSLQASIRAVTIVVISALRAVFRSFAAFVVVFAFPFFSSQPMSCGYVRAIGIGKRP